MVTRPRAQAAALSERLRARGARVIVAPAIRLVPAPAKAIDRALDRAVAGEFEWVIVTSRAGAETLLSRLTARGRDPKDVRARVAAVGDGTASVLRAGDLRPALVPPSFTTESLGRAMPKGTGNVLLARADIAPEGLERVLERKGWTVERVDAYRTRFPGTLPVAARRALAAGTVDAVVFTSASTVRGYLKAAGGVLRHPAMAAVGHEPKVVCIGPVTAAEARAAGLRVHATADPHTIEGLVAAVERALRGRARRARGGGAVRGPSRTTKKNGKESGRS
jgi:uroporphyrinogen III methyltransferase/synthase